MTHMEDEEANDVDVSELPSAVKIIKQSLLQTAKTTTKDNKTG